MEEETIVFGIPVPSTNKVFLAIVVIHIALSLACVIAGLVAMLSGKTGRIHPRAGKAYFWFMLLAFVTIVVLSVMRWPHNIHLLTIGTFAFILTYTGRRLTRTNARNWPRLHTMCMGMSYILLLTGFYIDNGKNLPFWRQFPQIFFWVFPAIVGIPIIVYALLKHPLNRKGMP